MQKVYCCIVCSKKWLACKLESSECAERKMEAQSQNSMANVKE